MDKSKEIKAAVKNEGRNLRWLSERTGIKYPTLSGYCSGKNVGEPELRLIALTLGIPASFFGLDDKFISHGETA